MMTKEIYLKLLKSKEWDKKRKIILTRDKYTCCRCHSYDIELHVHHKYYVEGKKPWQYPDSALITLCFLCHKAVHADGPKIEVRVPKTKKPKIKTVKKKIPPMNKRDKKLQKRYDSLKKR